MTKPLTQKQEKPKDKKKPVKRKAALKKTAAPTPAIPLHPLMINGKEWDKKKVMSFVCMRIATSSSGIVSILSAGCDGNTLPEYSTFMLWMSEDKEISDLYARAKEDQSDFMADEMLKIADSEVSEQVMVDGIPLERDGVPVMARTKVAVDHARLRVETRKWLAAKLKPKKYGDKLDVNTTVHNSDLTDEELDRRIAEKQALKK